MNNRQCSAGGGRHSLCFNDVISLENLLAAWREFRKGKRAKRDVAEFELRLEENLFALHRELVSGVWKPDPYIEFCVQDPKLRLIHKATVHDRVLYQAVYRLLYPLSDSGFIHDSYSSRNGKGTHRAVVRFETFTRKVSANFRKQAFVLKCDIKKFFDSVSHTVLLSLIGRKVSDQQLLRLIGKIVHSFETSVGKGLPLGNVTSQLFANMYLDELDQFAKHALKARCYIRYCDDFVFLSDSRRKLDIWIPELSRFLKEKLCLELHPGKIEVRKITQGIDFLGYVILPHYRVLRTRTKQRLLARVEPKSLSSYLGLLCHCKGEKIRRLIMDRFLC